MFRVAVICICDTFIKKRSEQFSTLDYFTVAPSTVLHQFGASVQIHSIFFCFQSLRLCQGMINQMTVNEEVAITGQDVYIE